MIPPINCPYNGLTATPCWRCTHHIADTDECTLNNRAHLQTSDNGTSYNTIASAPKSLEERMREYEKNRQELLQLSKEALVDLIIQSPTYFN